MGFRSNQGTVDAIFVARHLIEPAYLLLSLDWAKAFDSVAPGALVNALQRFGIPTHFCRVVQAFIPIGDFKRGLTDRCQRLGAKNTAVPKAVRSRLFCSPFCWIDDGSTSSSMVLPHAARPCAAMQHSCHLSDSMAAPKRERLSGMGSQLRRHSVASWHVTPNSLAVAPIACVLAAEVGGRGTTNPSAWCSASLHCVRAVPLPRCAPRPHRDGQGAGGVPRRLLSSERHAALSSVSGQCLRCPQPKTTCR